MNIPKLMTTQQAARYLNVSAAFLERDRCYTARIPFVRLGSRSVRYEQAELDKFVQRQRRRSTSDRG